MAEPTGVLAGYLFMGSEGLKPLADSPALNDAGEVAVFGAALGVMTSALDEVGCDADRLREESRTLAHLLSGNRDQQPRLGSESPREAIRGHASDIIHEVLEKIDPAKLNAAAKLSRDRAQQMVFGLLAMADAKMAAVTSGLLRLPLTAVVGAAEYNRFVRRLIDREFLKREQVFPRPPRGGLSSPIPAGRASEIEGSDEHVPEALFNFAVQESDRVLVREAIAILIWGVTEKGMDNQKFAEALLRLGRERRDLFDEKLREEIARKAEAGPLLPLRVLLERVRRVLT